ncbi:MAG TPA: tetratricopeptide repeat protein [Nitrospiria bacterium]|nr:tetratricopeptide repeat protein [Nitrospiria bacterium]
MIKRDRPVWWAQRLAWAAVATAVIGCSGCAGVSPEQKKQSLAHYQLGASRLGDNQMQEAFVEFQEAIKLNPGNRDAHYALGHIYFQQGRFDDASKEFHVVLTLKPDESEAFNYLGKVYEQQGKDAQAIEAYQSALKNPLYVTPEIPHTNLGMLYVKQKRVTDAIREFREAMRINPRYPVSYFQLGKLYIDLGMSEEAISVYKELTERYPDLLEANYQLALAYAKSGAKQSAMTYFDKVIKQAPNSALAVDAQQQVGNLK